MAKMTTKELIEKVDHDEAVAAHDKIGRALTSIVFAAPEVWGAHLA